MAIEHSVVSDPNIHEPKGITTASTNTVYISNGSGSGTWNKVGLNQLDQTDVDTRYALATYIRHGSGSPEGSVTAPIGTLYLRSDGGASTTLYVKESGTGSTGWVAK